jgi:hypothetical protein
MFYCTTNETATLGFVTNCIILQRTTCPVTYELKKEKVLMRLLVWTVKQLRASDELLWSISGMLTGRGKSKYAYTEKN